MTHENTVTTKGITGFIFTLFLLGVLPGARAMADPLAHGEGPVRHRGVWETELQSAEGANNPFFDIELKFVFTRPDSTTVAADGFFKGGQTWAGRACCDQVGLWSWRTQSTDASLDGQTGGFKVVPSDLPGKLRIHPDDPYQFAYDDGRWFLHIGDTGYRYVAPGEPLWRQYVDEAARVGFTKIRAWFCGGRSDVQALFAPGRDGLALEFWNEIDTRLLYALDKYPDLQFQLIPYGEDTAELIRYGDGDRASLLVARYAQARFSALPNVQWCISNDRDISESPGGRRVSPSVIDLIARDMRSREPWGTLLTNHQRRFQGYSFLDRDWSDITTLEDRDQVAGSLLLEYRAKGRRPVVLDEDRYGIYISPKHDRYFFRRLMWASLLSGGHATYGGLETYEPFAGPGKPRGVQGYLTAVKAGLLDDGAQDFRSIHQFFTDSELTLVGMRPDDALAGNDPARVKVARNETTIIAYLQNPGSGLPEEADVSETPASCRLDLPEGAWSARWFDPRNGAWLQAPGRIAGGQSRDVAAPFNGDAVLLLKRLER